MAPHHARSARRTASVRPALATLAVAAALLAAGCGQSSSPSGSVSPSDGAGSSRPADPSPGTKGESAAGDGAAGSAAPSSAPATAPSPEGEGTTGPSRQAAGFPWCSPGALSVALREMEPAAGNRYAALVFTNTSNEPCRTSGWPGLQLTSDAGRTIPTDTERDRSVRSRPLTLKPDDRAWSRLHWTVVPGTGDPADGACPEPGALRVIPPDERGQLTADWKLGTVCGAGEIEATALRTGEGPRH
ncbi:DUF4232 domain-containing protein [Streptomyces iconiensis]|uniref:DUF4232 domain-containing protein n=1 Tax=Streptomyces iconiensis TaxID=1384038 RepID=A0ABT7A2Y7_9ACTN|nr:DUF4232 domain-containing protein [Streptomyces iconiensis]MDJ1135694.1 DUF4232 domain-containing protein [Streptomyces iconiensis]